MRDFSNEKYRYIREPREVTGIVQVTISHR
jgi:hypothetical protein